ncbi:MULTISPECIES: hypothetical protein [Streptomyces]|uniref:Integral membrane protein n=1 Tax=Streptomyces aureus TaxID=193461 RepID=A0ABV4STS3_9ACTN|nr:MULTISPECIES: hypothetical protein [unclassified Streptomyces]WSD98303.1 hypothetical protein OG758_31610 [Streptomyces sp. NBC_01474]
MEHTPDAAWLTQVVNAAASDQQGAGNLLRTVIVVGVLGSVFLGWFLLRGYKRDD